jgi:hypothetical protein
MTTTPKGSQPQSYTHINQGKDGLPGFPPLTHTSQKNTLSNEQVDVESAP